MSEIPPPLRPSSQRAARRLIPEPVRPLEARRLMAAPVVVIGTASDDQITLGRDGADLVVTVNNIATHRPLADVAGVQIQCGTGRDLVTIDLAGGNPVPSEGVTLSATPVAGATPAGVILRNGSQDAVTVRPTGAGAGMIALDGGSKIVYSGFGSIDLDSDITQAIVELDDAGHTARLATSDFGPVVATLDADLGRVAFDPGTSDRATGNTFVLQGGTGADLFLVDRLSASAPEVILDGGPGGGNEADFAAGTATGYNIATRSIDTIRNLGLVAPTPVGFPPNGPLRTTAGVLIDNTVAGFFLASRPKAPLGIYAASIDWGDGTITEGQVAPDLTFPIDRQVRGSHTYASPGTYRIVAALVDQGGTETSLRVNGATITSDYAPSAAGFAIQTVMVDPALFPLTPVPVTAISSALISPDLATFTGPVGTAGIAFLASVDWGDGTGPQEATVITTAPASFAVRANHTYSRAGTYPIAVAVQPFFGAVSSTTTTATVAQGPYDATLAGTLDPASDSGVRSDGVTAVRTPTYRGTALPGSQVTLLDYTGFSTVIGTARNLGATRADAAGAWAITTSPLADGTHDLTIDSINSTLNTYGRTYLPPLVVDAIGPTLGTLAINRANGRFTLTVADATSDVDPTGLLDPASYRFRAGGGVKPLRLAGLTVVSASTTATISGRLNGNRRLPVGPITLLVRASGVRDSAGNTLTGGDQTVRFHAQRRALPLGSGSADPRHRATQAPR